MLFLLEYNRPHGKLISMRSFQESERRVAEDARLELELDLLRRGIDHEVVVLGAPSETILRTANRRYFEDLETLLRSSISEIKSFVTN
ncbi:MAG TPA: hypothetical protein VGN88_00770 [Phycisphaerae bacterium]|jgi:hypothetical protein